MSTVLSIAIAVLAGLIAILSIDLIEPSLKDQWVVGLSIIMMFATVWFTIVEKIRTIK